MNSKSVLQWMEQGSIGIPTMLMQNYKKLGLNETEFLLLLHLHVFIKNQKPFPTPSEFSDVMTLDAMECMEVVRTLIRKGFIKIETTTDERGILFESYSLQPLWMKVMEELLTPKVEVEEEKKEEKSFLEFGELYQMFEAEFGRPLSPFETETLGGWIDQDEHKPEIIKLALREAVLLGKINFRYIDRILFEWKKNGVKTTKAAVQQAEKFRQPVKTPPPAERPERTQQITLYNWLES